MRILYALSICILAIYVFVIAYSIYHRPRPERCICDTLSVQPAIYESSSALNDYTLRHHNPYLTGVYMEILEIDCMTARGRIVNNSAYTIILGGGNSLIQHFCEREQRWNTVLPRADELIAVSGGLVTETHPGEYISIFTRIREVNNMQYSGLFRLVITVYRDINPDNNTRPRWIDSERHSIASMFSW